jgi:hypothetical protein
MVTSSWLTAALGAAELLLSADGACAKPRVGARLAVSPSYRNLDTCLERCSVSGPNSGNWSVYPSFKQIKTCEKTTFYDFSLYDQVDDLTASHRIHACSSSGPDFSKIPESKTRIASTESVDVDFQVGWWDTCYGQATSGLRSPIKQTRKYVDHGHGVTDTPFIMFAQSGQATIGLYIGQGLLNQGISTTALKILQDNLSNLNVSTPSLAMQLCGPDNDSSHIFGIMATSNGTFAPIQYAIKTWSNVTCLSFSGSVNFTGQVQLSTPLANTNTNTTTMANSTMQTKARFQRKRYNTLHARDECKVESGDSCASLATKCGILGDDFAKINSADDFCANLKPKQHVCCLSGDLPVFSPKPNEDGSCYQYETVADDNCDNLAAEYSLTRQDLEGFNQKTWGWNGCQLLYTPPSCV